MIFGHWDGEPFAGFEPILGPGKPLVLIAGKKEAPRTRRRGELNPIVRRLEVVNESVGEACDCGATGRTPCVLDTLRVNITSESWDVC